LFDVAVVSEKEITAKIESIADGQYQVKEWVDSIEEDAAEEQTNDEDEEGSAENEVIEVSLPSFEIPNLFTLLMDQI